MIVMKKQEFDRLIDSLSQYQRCTNLLCREKSLINYFKDADFCRNIPSIWTD